MGRGATRCVSLCASYIVGKPTEPLGLKWYEVCDAEGDRATRDTDISIYGSIVAPGIGWE